jgi:hypothetical protein
VRRNSVPYNRKRLLSDTRDLTVPTSFPAVTLLAEACKQQRAELQEAKAVWEQRTGPGVPEIGNPRPPGAGSSGLAGMGGFGIPEIPIRPVSGLGESTPMPGHRGFRGLPSGSSGPSQC